MPPFQAHPPPFFHMSPGQVALSLPVIPFSDSAPEASHFLPIQPSMVGRIQTSLPVLASSALMVPTTPNSDPAMATSALPWAMMGVWVMETPAA
jgi:hypothetical protein